MVNEIRAMQTESMAKLKAMIKRHEGLRLDVYECSTGHKTVGYGHKLTQSELSVLVSPITLDKAEHLFMTDLVDAIMDTTGLIGDSYYKLSDVRRAVLIDMCFNLGRGGLAGFKNMLSAVNAEDWQEAHDEMLNSRYAKQVGDRAVELADMMLHDTWQLG